MNDYQFKVTVTPAYVPAESDPASNRYVFAYTIVIENVGSQPARLMRRHWLITNGNGEKQEVQGPGSRGEAAAPGSRRAVSLYQCGSAGDRGRRDAGSLRISRR